MRLKVLHITSTPCGISGVENLLISMSRNYNRNKYQFIFCNIFADCKKEQSFPNEIRESGDEIINLFGSSYREAAVIFYKLLKIIKYKKVDIVHTWMFHSNFLGQLAAFILKVRVRIISRQYKDFLYLCKGKSEQVVDLISERLCSHIVACSEGVKEHLMEVERVQPGRISVIYNSVDLAKMIADCDAVEQLKAQFSLNNCVVVGTIARLYPTKGHRYLLKAINIIKAAHPNLKLLLVGDGPLKSELMRLSREYSIEKNVLFFGHRTDIPELLSLIDIVVQPSLEEGFGITMIEAMSLEKPVIGSRVGGIPEVIDDGVTGLLVPPADAEALASAISELIKQSAKRKELGLAGRARVEKKFTIDVMLEEYEKLYSEAILLTKR